MQTSKEIATQIARLEQELSDARTRQVTAQESEQLAQIAEQVQDAKQRLDDWCNRAETASRAKSRLRELREQLPQQERHVKEVESELRAALKEQEAYPDSDRVSRRVSRARHALGLAREGAEKMRQQIAALESAV